MLIARILQSDVDVITQQPITEVITKVVEVIRYKNKTVYFTESNSAPSSADEGIQMTLTLALTVGMSLTLALTIGMTLTLALTIGMTLTLATPFHIS